MPPLEILRLNALPDTYGRLRTVSENEGFSMLGRLETEWRSGLQRFDGSGEILFGAFRGPGLAATAGLSRDPYLDDPALGRIRHVYVHPELRRCGLARRLVGQLIAEARPHYRRLRLFTGRAALFYESLGFSPVEGDHVSHQLILS